MPGFELIGKEEKKAISKLFDEGGVLFAHGFTNNRKNFHVREFEKRLAKKFNSKFALPVSSGTSAIKIALKSLNIKPGDEVITQAFNFIATVEAIYDIGAIPKICNVDKTLNLDPEDLKRKISKKTKAIVPVHMLGASCDMHKIKSIAKKFNVPILEDNCEAVGAKLRNKYLGTIGDLGVMSFDFAKIITTGEGGAILTNNKKHYKYCKEYHDHGHENNVKLPRGNDTSSVPGFNYRITEMQAIVGKVQLNKINFILKENKKRYEALSKRLSDLYEVRRIIKNSNQNYETFIIIEKNKNIRNKIVNFLNKEGFGTRNLPDAIKWHCSYYWTRAIGKKEARYSKRTLELLKQCIAIPIWLKKNEKKYKNLGNSIRYFKLKK